MTLVGKVIGAVIKSSGFRNALSKVAKCGKGVTSPNKLASKYIFKSKASKLGKSQDPLLQFVEKEAKKGNVVDNGLETLKRKEPKDFLWRFLDEVEEKGEVVTDPASFYFEKGKFLGDF